MSECHYPARPGFEPGTSRLQAWYVQDTSPSRYDWAIGAGHICLICDCACINSGWFWSTINVLLFIIVTRLKTIQGFSTVFNRGLRNCSVHGVTVLTMEFADNGFEPGTSRLQAWYVQDTSPSRYDWAIGAGHICLICDCACINSGWFWSTINVLLFIIVTRLKTIQGFSTVFNRGLRNCSVHGVTVLTMEFNWGFQYLTVYPADTRRWIVHSDLRIKFPSAWRN